MKNLFLSYLLCGLGLVTPFAGLHRFYLHKPLSGIFYLLTWGFFGIGSVIDLFRMTELVETYNLRFIFAEKLREGTLPLSPSLSLPEHSILSLAQKHNGVITTEMASLACGLSLAQTKKELDTLFKQGFCQKDVDEDGNEIYIFKGFSTKGTTAVS